MTIAGNSTIKCAILREGPPNVFAPTGELFDTGVATLREAGPVINEHLQALEAETGISYAASVIRTAISWVGGIGGLSGDWNTLADWTPQFFPSPRTATIGLPGSYTVTNAQPNPVYHLAITDADATLAVNGGALTILGSSRNAGTIAIADGNTMQLAARLQNAGTVALQSALHQSTLVIIGSVSLAGSGALTLSDSAQNAIVSNGEAATLVNQSQISGAGTIGDATLSLVNGSSGVIDATGSAEALIIAAASFANHGLIEATGAAGAVIEGSLANSGTISALGSDLLIQGDITGSGRETLFGNSDMTFEGSVSKGQTVAFEAGAQGTLILAHAESFAGTVTALSSAGDILLADFAYGDGPRITHIAGTGDAGTDTILTIKDGALTAKIALLNQYTGQFGLVASAYVMTGDSRTGTSGTLLELAAAHV